MITKYIGSVFDIQDCDKIALVYTSIMLQESSIKDYKLDYSGYDLQKIIHKIDEEFIADIIDPITFNALIMYKADTTPVGFTILNSPISTAEYKIKRVGVILNFMTNSQGASYIELDLGNVFYEQHIINTPKVHKDLIPEHAPSRSSLIELHRESSFGNTIKDIKSDKYYRYSGDLYKGLDKIISSEIKLPNDLNDIKLFKYDDSIFFYGTKERSLIIIYKNRTIELQRSKYGDPVLQGSNYFVFHKNDRYQLWSTKSLLTDNPVLLNELPDKYKFVKNFSNHEISEYVIKDGNIITRSEFLTDLLDRCSIPNEDMLRLTDIRVIMPGLIGYTTTDDDGDHYKYLTDVLIGNTNVFSYDLPHEVVTSISNKALLVKRRTNDAEYWILLLIEPIDQIRFTTNYKVTYHNLGYKNNWRRLDLLSKSKLNPKNLDILMQSIDGSLFKIVNSKDNLVITRL